MRTPRTLAERFSAAAGSAEPGSVADRVIDGIARLHARLYGVSGGRVGGTMSQTRICLLTTTGRRSGKPRSVTVACVKSGRDVVVVGSNSGRDTDPAWYHNLLARPRASVQLGRASFDADARTAVGEERAQLWAAVLASAPAMADYEQRTARKLPVVVLTPIGDSRPPAVTGSEAVS